MNPETRTKTSRARVARRARQHGYFHDRDSSQIAVNCPLCREKVETAQPRGGESIIRALDAAMEDHLRRDCEHGPQQYR
ncbi:hypothetical protein AB0C10_16260 [Microbispora amethystogenes]|uniref:hypothetical protein n=1 Tax=Microbispora amethystogenes TaxID=1427754 RepID=UPI0033F8CE67